MSELKRAFDIPGFVEGETIIRKNWLPKNRYRYNKNEFIVEVSRDSGEWEVREVSLCTLNYQQWIPVPDPSKEEKWYRHVYVYGSTDAELTAELARWSKHPWDMYRVLLSKTGLWHISTEEFYEAPWEKGDE